MASDLVDQVWEDGDEPELREAFAELLSMANGAGWADRVYLAVAMLVCAGILDRASVKIVKRFPDRANDRMRIGVTFNPGPKSNRRRWCPHRIAVARWS